MSKIREKIKIRKVEAKDADILLGLINALADYEKLSRPNDDARRRLKNDIFGHNPKGYVYLAEVNNKPVAYAFYFFTYSSFLAKPTLYLEDIFVLPEYRSKGIGKALFQHCVKMAHEEDCGRMEWMILDWNKTAIDFYEKVGAKQIKEWLPYRLDEKQLEKILQDS